MARLENENHSSTFRHDEEAFNLQMFTYNPVSFGFRFSNSIDQHT